VNQQTDESRRLAAALRAAGADSRPRDDCPEPDRIWGAARLELPLDERQSIIDHTIECPTCAEAWRLAVEFGRDAPAPAAASSKPAVRSSKPANWTWLRAAATILLPLGLGVALWFSRPSVGPVVREPGTGQIQSQLKDGESLPRDDFRLRWSSGSAGERYEITVTTADLGVIVTARGLDRPEYRVPSERLAGLPSGTRVLWRIVAQAPDGGTISSPTFEVAVR
jgi:hypothetical protein